MANLLNLYDSLRSSQATSDVDCHVTVELVVDITESHQSLAKRLQAALPDKPVDIEEALSNASARFFVLRFPELSAEGKESSGFALARALKIALGAREGNFAPIDAFYGEAMLRREMPGFESSVFSCSTAQDDGAPPTWHHGLIDTLGAWNSTRGEGVVVGVIDTGFSDHPELQGTLSQTVKGLNLIEAGSEPRDQFSRSGLLPNPGHGTLVGSVVASRGDIQSGEVGGPGKITGVAPEASLVYIRAIRSVVDIQQARLPKAIVHATDSGCNVIVMCLGGPSRIAAVEAALRYAVDKGVVVVCAAGNCYPFVVFPAAYSKDRLAVAVAAVGQERKPWAKSARGAAVTVSAPGEDVWGASISEPNDTSGRVKPAQGTTLATSMTAGVAALWIAKHGADTLKAIAKQRKLTVQELFMRAIVHAISKPPEWKGASDLGDGIVNASRALAFDVAAALGFEAAASDRPKSDEITSTLEIFRRHVRDYNQLAAEEIDESMDDVAAELLWRSFRRGAAARSQAMTGLEQAASPPLSTEARDSVEKAPALKSFVGA